MQDESFLRVPAGGSSGLDGETLREFTSVLSLYSFYLGAA